MQDKIEPSTQRIRTNHRTEYLQAIQEWNTRLAATQRGVRLLDAIRWSDRVEEEFLAGGCRELPRMSVDDYRSRPIAFEPLAQIAELRAIERDILYRLGSDDAAARLLLRRCRHFRDTMRLIATRGTREFGHLSRTVFGSSHSAGGLRKRLERLIDHLNLSPHADRNQPSIPAAEVACELQRRFREAFGEDTFRVFLVSELAADASAGRDYLKLRRDARFSPGDIQMLEVHEVWVHLTTTRNGGAQPIFPILGRVSAGVSTAQEGLAVLAELVAGVCHQARQRKLALRFRCVLMAEDGADFLEVFDYIRGQGFDDRAAYRHAARVFRGSLPSGAGPFTKDLGYGLGLIEIAGLLRSALQSELDAVSILFSGKVGVDDWNDLEALFRQGLLAPGTMIPPPFRDRQRLRAALRELPVA